LEGADAVWLGRPAIDNQPHKPEHPGSLAWGNAGSRRSAERNDRAASDAPGVLHPRADAEHWERQENILDSPGQRTDDGAIGGHADVEVQGDRAFIFYFTHPDWDRTQHYGMHEAHPYHVKRTSLQVAELELRADRLVCDRNKPFDFTLSAA
jgi:hypothetical protein